MQSLYTDGFEHIYDAMYQTFIDYDAEFMFYNAIKEKHAKKQILELGCGSGNLARKFIQAEVDYTGLDLSEAMVTLSCEKNPKGTFIQGDITNFSLDKKVDFTIITGRTTSYLLTNEDVSNALKSIADNLEKDGILCFDFIDASRFFKDIKGGKKVEHSATLNGKQYYRESYLKETTQNNFMFSWDAVYYQDNMDASNIITKDASVVRAFTKEEWELLLYLNGFKVLEFIDRKSYFFDTYVVVAKKM
jgi:SAM-dependent methyltransferase